MSRREKLMRLAQRTHDCPRFASLTAEADGLLGNCDFSTIMGSARLWNGDTELKNELAGVSAALTALGLPARVNGQTCGISQEENHFGSRT